MSKKLQTFGDRPAKYRCWLNPYDFTRASSCPRCEKPTYPRKFPLVIATEGTTAPIVLGLTCKYCSKCELIVAHKDVIEGYLYQHFSQHQPEVIGNDFFIAATMELSVQAIKSLLSRARLNLQKILAPYMEQGLRPEHIAATLEET